MIGKLTGLVDETGDGWAILDVGGVGYLLSASAKTLAALPPGGKPARLLVETQIRDDRIVLFGFHDAIEREWFRLLQTVQGVGPKVALAVLSVLAVDDLVRAIGAADKAAVGRASGVGPKLAQRIVAELKDKAPELGPAAGSRAEPGTPERDAVSVLVNLGYGRSEAFVAIAEASRGLGAGTTTVETLVRAGLKELAR
ncbi:MAG: Holliday junction branch migration protein RuvA [Alphaproteobacteria bacterium]|nr:Holliday junction branch migration protein RuvA [Alphaproteobacteria bacterium]